MENYLVNVKHDEGDGDGDILDTMIVEADSIEAARSQVLEAFGAGWSVIGSRKLVTVTPDEDTEPESVG